MIPFSLLFWAHFIALAFWLPSVAFLLYFSNPAKKRSAYDRTVLGVLVSRIFKMLNCFKFICWFLLIISGFQFLSFFKSDPFRISTDITLIAVMGFLTGIYSFILTPRMDRLRTSVLTLESKGPNHDAVLRYVSLHQRYVQLLVLNLGLGLGTLFLSLGISMQL